MPRIKQSPKKNPRDLPNPTNWASILWNNHCKYLYLNFCSRMLSDGCIFWLDRCILRRDGYKLLILKICTLLYIVNLFNFAAGCGGTDTCSGGTDVFGGGTVVYCGGIVAFCAPLALVFLCSSLMYCVSLPLSLYHFIVCMFCKCFSLAFASSIVSVSSLNQALSSTCVSYHLYKCILCLYCVLLFTCALLCDYI